MDDKQTARVDELIDRFNQLDRLLYNNGEPYDDESLSDPGTLADIEMILAELDKASDEIVKTLLVREH